MNNRRIGARAIIFRDGKLLANKFPTKGGGESEYWATPGGGLDSLESLTDGTYREMIEETGIAPKIGRLLFIQQFASNRADCNEELEFFFLIENPEDYETIDLAATSHGAIEHTRSEFIDPKTEPILPAFLQTIDIEDYVMNHRPVFLSNNLT